MKKTLAVLSAACGIFLGLAANVHADDKLVVGATAVPHAEILSFIKPQLAREGVNLDIQVFTDYVQPNVQVAGKRLDANFFQHKPYLDDFNKSQKMDLVSVVGVHIEPFGIYSKKIQKLEDLKDGATVAIPNDATNGGRALLLLEKMKLIQLKDPNNITATVRDIAANPKRLEIKELEAAMLPRLLHQFDIALINTNYAIQAKLDPNRDALAMEDKRSPYVNILVARPDNAQSPAMKKLAAALTSPEVKKYILEKYKGAVVPAF